MIAISRGKLLIIVSFLFSLPAAYYFMNNSAIPAIAFVILSDMAGLSAAKAVKKDALPGWKPQVKIAIERCMDAAIFVGFALSGIVPRNYGLALLVAAIILPFWIHAIWKKGTRPVFHLLAIAAGLSSVL